MTDGDGAGLSDHAAMQSGVRTSGRWFGPTERPLLGWLTVPESGAGTSCVLILPPIGYQYWSSHRSLRTLAERVAGKGHMVLRIDYDGTGDSSGDQWDLDRLAAWRASAKWAVEELRSLGAQRLVVFGARLGGTIALLDGAELGADMVTVWAPVTSGRRYAKEIRLLSTAVPEKRSPDGHAGAMVSAGTVFTSQTLSDIAELKTTAATAAPAPSVQLVEDPSEPQDGTVARLRELGCQVDHQRIPGGERALEAPAEYATVPQEIVDTIALWIGSSSPPNSSLKPPAARPTTVINDRDVSLEEEVVTLGPRNLIGILTRPQGSESSRPVAVFLNAGSEPHVGPGRAWVEYTRRLAELGYPCVRVDFSGWGESPDEGHAPGRPYDAHCEQDTVEIVEALRSRGYEEVVLIGLCASAWIALRAVLRIPVAGVIALNPQLYWSPGDPVEATMAETRTRRAPTRLWEERGRLWRWWTVLDLLGRRPESGRWIERLHATGIPILMLFAADDDGIEYLRNRVARRLGRARKRGLIKIAEVPDIDHSMHRAWLRERIIESMWQQLKRIEHGREQEPARLQDAHPA